MSDIRDTLNTRVESPFWDEAYAKALLDEEIPTWLTPEFINMLNEDYGVLQRTYDIVISALPKVLAVRELCLLAKTVYHILDKRLPYSKSFKSLELPSVPDTDENALGYRCVLVFPVLMHVHKTWCELIKRGLPRDVVSASLFWVDFLFDEAIKKTGKLEFGLDCFKPYSVAIYVNSLIIGRLRFEIAKESDYPVRVFENKDGEHIVLFDNVTLHKSGHILGSYACYDTDGAYAADFLEAADFYEGYTVNPVTRLAERNRTRLSKSEWRAVYIPGNSVLRVHIPYGGRLNREICDASYRRAREIFKNYYSEYIFSSFMLECWMLSPELTDILPPESNIVSFASPYLIYPVKNSAEDAIFYVFGIEDSTLSGVDVDSLPEDSSLRRGVKAKLKEGRPIYEFGGYIPF